MNGSATFLAVLLGTAGCNTADIGPVNAENLFPLENGRTLVFRTSRDGRKESITFTKDERSAAFWSMRLSGTYAGEETWFLGRDEKGINLLAIGVGHGAIGIDPPLLLIPKTVTDGISWLSRGTVKPVKGHTGEMPEIQFSLAGSRSWTDIVVGEATYKARQVDFRMTSGKSPAEERIRRGEARAVLWLVPGTGIIKLQNGTIRSDTNSVWPQDNWELLEAKK
jgi:hypothetical protein